MPSINVKLKLPGLTEIAREFETKGYLLADKNLINSADEISDLDLVLGNNDAQVLPQTEVVFGMGDSSVYSSTPRGVMLLGSVHRMRKNLAYLPDLSRPNECEMRSYNIESDVSSKSPMLDGTTYYSSCNENDEVDEEVLTAAAEEILKQSYFSSHQYMPLVNDTVNESEAKLNEYVLSNTKRAEDGRLIMPLLWREEVAHLLASNLHLSKQVVKSNLKRLTKNPERLKMYDDVIQEQVKLGIIERIANVPQFLEENPTASFLPHMGVFKLNNETTKCRIVFLSNLIAGISNNKSTISHNQAMISGPNLNRKITTAILKMRFDKHLLCFDLQKAFLSIAISPVDQNRLLFLWCKNVAKNNHEIVAYRNLRLPFGLKCSPALLMLGLYKILLIDTENDTEEMKNFKKLIYDLIYMDNGCVTTNCSQELGNMRTLLEEIFAPYQFQLQKMFTNNVKLQNELDNQHEEKTPSQVKLLGLVYDREEDTIATAPLKLDCAANTKRKILSSLASNFDVFQFVGPLLNRARLFVHLLQCEQTLEWDTVLSEMRLREWRCIVKQVTASSPIKIKRFVGCRNGSYRLIGFTDASKVMIGVVVYIQEIKTSNVSFLLSKNRIVNKQLETKSIPSLELQAVAFGVDSLMEIYQELTGDSSIIPIKIKELQLYSDSMVTLSWINKYVNSLEKMQKVSVFVKNRLEAISKQCSICPVKFHFISGQENPADVVTRAISYKQFIKTNFHTGPLFLKQGTDTEFVSDLCFAVPNPLARSLSQTPVTSAGLAVSGAVDRGLDGDKSMPSSTVTLIPVQRYASFQKLVRVWQYVLKYIKASKRKVSIKHNRQFPNENWNQNLFLMATNSIIKQEQQKHFPAIYDYFDRRTRKMDMPTLVGQLNIFKDSNGVLRVRSKFREWPENRNQFPILLPKTGPIAEMIVRDYHERLSHAGCYSVLAQLKKQFHLIKSFAIVRKFLNKCVKCKKQNARTVKLNQSYYRDFRENPTSIPYADVFVDHFGPYTVFKDDNKKTKIWVLCVTCLWSRAINLKVCYDLTVSEFLRTFQLHIYEYGLPVRVFSDLGTQLVAGANIIADHVKDVATQLYFAEHGIKTPQFTQFFKGHKALGSLVESCVKISKRALYGAMGKTVLPNLQFELLIAQTVSVVNKRPVAFREYLRSDEVNVPEPITPELLVRGYEPTAISIIPMGHAEEEWKPNVDPIDKIKINYTKLSQIRQKFAEIYRDEFLSLLIQQAVNKKDRFKPVTHKKLQINDIVLLKEENTKRVNFPMAIIQKIIHNDLGEITAVEVKKGKSGETLKRHSSSIIPVLSHECPSIPEEMELVKDKLIRSIPKRAAALKAARLTKQLCEDGFA